MQDDHMQMRRERKEETLGLGDFVMPLPPMTHAKKDERQQKEFIATQESAVVESSVIESPDESDDDTRNKQLMSNNDECYRAVTESRWTERLLVASVQKQYLVR